MSAELLTPPSTPPPLAEHRVMDFFFFFGSPGSEEGRRNEEKNPACIHLTFWDACETTQRLCFLDRPLGGGVYSPNTVCELTHTAAVHYMEAVGLSELLSALTGEPQ